MKILKKFATSTVVLKNKKFKKVAYCLGFISITSTAIPKIKKIEKVFNFYSGTKKLKIEKSFQFLLLY